MNDQNQTMSDGAFEAFLASLAEAERQVDEEVDIEKLMEELDAGGVRDDGASDQPVSVENVARRHCPADEGSVRGEESEESSIEPASVNEADLSGIPTPFGSPPKQPEQPPEGFAVFSDGVYMMPEDESAEPIYVCTPIRVDAVFAAESGTGWGKLVSVKSPNGSWHEVPVLNADIERRQAEVIGRLVDHGLELSIDRKSKERLILLLKAWKPFARLTTMPCMGWVSDSFSAFVLGDKVLGNAKVLPMVPPSGVAAGLSSRGTVEAWTRNVGAKCQGKPRCAGREPGRLSLQGSARHEGGVLARGAARPDRAVHPS